MPSIPPFTSAGVLPDGDHPATFAELRASHVVQGPPDRPDWASCWRLALLDAVEILVRQLWEEGVGNVFLGGSFVEDVARPRDIDGYFPCDLEQLGDLIGRLNARDPFRVWTWDDDARRPEPWSPTLQFPMWHVYRAELYPDCGQLSGQSGPQGPLGFPAMFRSRKDRSPKGIIHLVPGGDLCQSAYPYPLPAVTRGVAPLVREALRGQLMHARILEALAACFQDMEGVIGAWVNGSIARGELDRFSDLDLGIVLRDAESLERLWAHRWNWEVPRWFHRLEGDHYKPHFLTYLFEPGVKVDISLTLVGQTLDPASGPYLPVWDLTGEVAHHAALATRQVPVAPDWGSVVHDDERFWSLAYSMARKLQRGDLYDVAAMFVWFRDVVERWQAYLSGRSTFATTKVERREPPEICEMLAGLFPPPEPAALRLALLHAMDAVDAQRAAMEARGVVPAWRTPVATRQRIRALVVAAGA